jgi:tetratricopeptide (TPR) repeat protein
VRKRGREVRGSVFFPEPGDGEAGVPGAAAAEAGEPSRLEMARLHRDRGDLALAIMELEAARLESPEDVGVMVELGAVLAAAGRPADAEKVLRRALRSEPDWAQAYHHLGVLLLKRGLYRPAIAELRRALELDEQSGDTYFYLGEALNQVGEVDSALSMLERAVQYQPTNARAYFTMGLLYDRKHLRQEATTMYRKARELGAA